MKSNFSTRLFGRLYLDSFMKGMKLNSCAIADKNQLKKEYEAVVRSAKDIGKSRMMSAYCMGAFLVP